MITKTFEFTSGTSPVQIRSVLSVLRGRRHTSIQRSRASANSAAGSVLSSANACNMTPYLEASSVCSAVYNINNSCPRTEPFGMEQVT